MTTNPNESKHKLYSWWWKQLDKLYFLFSPPLDGLHHSRRISTPVKREDGGKTQDFNRWGHGLVWWTDWNIVQGCLPKLVVFLHKSHDKALGILVLLVFAQVWHYDRVYHIGWTWCTLHAGIFRFLASWLAFLCADRLTRENFMREFPDGGLQLNMKTCWRKLNRR